ncbi:hypothetical protein A0H81_03173 [Grifola frondosa]|uniref:Uncharacterized protein n=1 Tax=Grifola frondosa TaxID=5627 RepID=A0A1C7MJM5_GRIFR|nr:hypothetical protein A0H81_03173 [Grifola frondosa]
MAEANADVYSIVGIASESVKPEAFDTPDEPDSDRLFVVAEKLLGEPHVAVRGTCAKEKREPPRSTKLVKARSRLKRC